jgi:hypothetical protein
LLLGGVREQVKKRQGDQARIQEQSQGTHRTPLVYRQDDGAIFDGRICTLSDSFRIRCGHPLRTAQAVLQNACRN